MIRCPDCGEDEQVFEKPGMLISLYTCKVCGCEFRKPESDDVCDLWEKIDKIEDELEINDNKLEQSKVDFSENIKELLDKNKMLLKERYQAWCKINELRQVWKDKLKV
jgi:rubredoxin